MLYASILFVTYRRGKIHNPMCCSSVAKRPQQYTPRPSYMHLRQQCRTIAARALDGLLLLVGSEVDVFATTIMRIAITGD